MGLTKRVLIDNGDGTHTVPLTKGLSAIIDSADAEAIGKYNWHASKVRSGHYAKRATLRGGVPERFYMHREIVSAPDGMEVDHKNGDMLDNRRSNLRVCTREQNAANQRIPVTNTSGLKGVSWNKHAGRYGARIRIDGKARHLGYFDTPEAAHAAYCAAAVERRGEFARTG